MNNEKYEGYSNEYLTDDELEALIEEGRREYAEAWQEYIKDYE